MAKRIARPAMRSRDVQGSLARRAAAPPAPRNPLTVYATRRGFYDGNRLAPGQAFTLHKDGDFERRWMSRTPPKAEAPVAPPAKEPRALGEVNPLHAD